MKYLLIFINDLTSAAYYTIFDATIFIFDVTSFFHFLYKVTSKVNNENKEHHLVPF